MEQLAYRKSLSCLKLMVKQICGWYRDIRPGDFIQTSWKNKIHNVPVTHWKKPHGKIRWSEKKSLKQLCLLFLSIELSQRPYPAMHYVSSLAYLWFTNGLWREWWVPPLYQGAFGTVRLGLLIPFCISDANNTSFVEDNYWNGGSIIWKESGPQLPIWKHVYQGQMA